MSRSKLKASTDERPFFLVYQDFIKSDVLDTAEQKLLFIIVIIPAFQASRSLQVFLN